MDLYYVGESATRRRAPDHQRRVELPSRRRDLLRHGHRARGRACWRRATRRTCPTGKKAAEGGKAHIYDIQPQMWIYEKDELPRRSSASPGICSRRSRCRNYRAILLRGIAWAGKRANLDEFCKPEELDALTYPRRRAADARRTRSRISRFIPTSRSSSSPPSRSSTSR